MISFDRFERRLPELLDELATPRLPDYADDLFARTAATRQRAGWTFPERWTLMSAVTRRFAAVPNIPWRLGVAVAILALVALLAIVAAGALSRHVPAPFGPAANGLIPYVANGSIYVGDPGTGTTRLLVEARDDQARPQFSPDGTQVVFTREAAETEPTAVKVYVVQSDGSHLTLVTPTPLRDFKWLGWTPDSRQVAVVHGADGENQLDVYDAQGSGSVRRLAAAVGLDSLAYRPPDGAEILFRQRFTGADGFISYRLSVMNADGSNLHTIVNPAVSGDTLDLTNATWSADGKRVFYNRWTDDASAGEPGCCQLYVVNADGTDEHEFIPNSGTAWDGQALVSPNGSRIAFWHHQNDGSANGLFVIRADGTGPVVEAGPAYSTTVGYVWAPDSSKILMIPNDNGPTRAYLLDPDGGPSSRLPWVQDSDIGWQRVAP